MAGAAPAPRGAAYRRVRRGREPHGEETTVRVSVLGTGAMGTGVAQSLLRAGHDVTVWNRTEERARPLAESGAAVAADAADAVSQAQVVLLTLFDTDAVAGVLEHAAGDAPQDAVWVQASTIGVAGTETVVQLAQKYGITLVEAMMLGTKAPAEQGKLTMLVAGADDPVSVVEPVLDAVSAKVVRAGDQVGQGTALKLAANAWIASITAATGQSLAIARALGLDPQLFLDAIDGSASDSAYAHTKGAAMISGQFPAQFALDGLRKDIGLITDAARDSDVDTTLLDALGRVYADASAAGHGGDDIAAVGTAF
ncbi:NAD(P)-dependent oxidoreductase [Curtobacterium sp. MCPF17_031]|uniref:NAD(P)-dependent oxidoreductase n=1 Tax=Curtobacterium sp. MCPF17_031 TaxID=2175653 RepID=UPI0035CCD9B0